MNEANAKPKTFRSFLLSEGKVREELGTAAIAETADIRFDDRIWSLDDLAGMGFNVKKLIPAPEASKGN